jgi:hypothetical protein
MNLSQLREFDRVRDLYQKYLEVMLVTMASLSGQPDFLLSPTV